MRKHDESLATLARLHLKTAQVAHNCALEGRISPRWVRIAALAAATAAVDACLQPLDTEWAQRTGAEKSAALRRGLVKRKLGLTFEQKDKWSRLEVAYDDRYDATHECSVQEAEHSCKDAESLVGYLIGLTGAGR